MSVQTFSDIIVNQQTKFSDLQLSAQSKDFILDTEKSSKFSDLISFYKEETNTDYSNSTDITSSETVSEANEKDKVSNTEKQESPKTEKSETAKATDKSKSADATEEKKLISKDEKSNVEIKSEKSEKKSTKLEKKSDSKDVAAENQKISPENFSIINELAENVAKKVENTDKSEKNQKSVEVDFESAGEKSAVDAKLLETLEMTVNANGQENQNLENFDEKNESFAEILEKAQNKSEKKTLDVDGKISVEDLRTEKSEIAKEEPKLKTELKINNENTATITMEFAQKNVNADVLSLNNQTASSIGSNYQQMLNNQVVMNTPEFVKAGNIVLKDNNQGTINLVLHPDDLGNVKIYLTLDGKSLSGHITVASKEALQVFKDNAETLREAFIKSGFDAANFDVSYGGNNSFADNSGFQERNDGTQMFGRKIYGSVSAINDDVLEDFIKESANSENFSINIVA